MDSRNRNLGGAGFAFAYHHTVSGNMHEGVDDDLRDVLVDTQYAGVPISHYADSLDYGETLVVLGADWE